MASYRITLGKRLKLDISNYHGITQKLGWHLELEHGFQFSMLMEMISPTTMSCIFKIFFFSELIGWFSKFSMFR